MIPDIGALMKMRQAYNGLAQNGPVKNLNWGDDPMFGGGKGPQQGGMFQGPAGSGIGSQGIWGADDNNDPNKRFRTSMMGAVPALTGGRGIGGMF